MARIVPATPEWIAEASRVLRGGGLVAMPTETVYGLAADAGSEQAVAKIFAAKGRPSYNPLIVHIPAPDEANAGADLSQSSEQYYALAEAFWPGPLTLVLPKRETGCEIANIVTAGGSTVAFRMPNHPVALALIRASCNLAAPSANRSEAVSPTRPEHVAESLGDAVDLILDGGPCHVGLESTVLSLVDPNTPRLLRPGAISQEQIAAVLGLMPAYTPASAAPEDAPLASPGQMRRHYAPKKQLIIVNDFSRTSLQGGIGVIARAADIDATGMPLSPTNALRLMPSDPEGYSRDLYAALREMDDDPAVKTIILCSVPDSPEWLAVRDRLSRASAQ